MAIGDMVRARRGLSTDVVTLLGGELGWEEDTLVFKIGDNSGTAPRIMTTKSTGIFDYTNSTQLLTVTGGSINGTPIGQTTPAAAKATSIDIDNGAGNNNNLLRLMSSDVNHGATTIVTNNVYGWMKRNSSIEGGLYVAGLSNNLPYALNIQAFYKGNDTVLSSGTPLNQLKGVLGKGAMTIDVQRHYNNALANMDSADNAFVIRTRTGGSLNAVMIVDATGDIYVNGSNTLTTFDTYDDIRLLDGLRATILPPKDVMKEQLSKQLAYARPVLEKAGIVTYDNETGNAFLSMKGISFLTMDAVRQLGEKLKQSLEKIATLEAKLSSLETKMVK